VSGPWLRPALHAATALSLLLLFIVPWSVLRAGLWLFAALALGVDLVRVRSDRIHGVLSGLVPAFRDAERRRVSGATWLVLGYAAASLFPWRAPLAGILVAALADPAAAVLGSRYGRGHAKSAVGSAACFAVAVCVMLGLDYPVGATLLTAVAATVLERWPGRFSDNVILPPGAAAIAFLAT
jgi:dolichol kinase